MAEYEPFNPLALAAIGRSVVRELLAGEVHPLPPADSFPGSGIYALYYTGDFPAYRPIAEWNSVEEQAFEAPIYIGRAVPAGARKGGDANEDFEVSPKPRVYERLRKHARSIDDAKNLELSHFYCRYLIVAPVWIRLAETVLVSRYESLWNSCIDGFGNNDPGRGRYAQARSKWDTLHPGRPWAEKLQKPPYTNSSLVREIKEFLSKEGPIPQA